MIDSKAQRTWTAQEKLDGEGRHVGDTTTMDNKDDASATAMSTRSAMEATKDQDIKRRSSIKLNNNFI